MARNKNLDRTNWAQLTTRQAEIAEMLAQGKLQAEISEKMGLSPKSVKSYIQLAYDRLPSLEGLEGMPASEALAGWWRQNHA